MRVCLCCEYFRLHMVAPSEYQRATDHFYEFLTDLRDIAGFTTRHPRGTTTKVFQALRRLELRDAIRFAGVLPAGLRALFVADWDPDEPSREFGDRESMTKEVLASDQSITTRRPLRFVTSHWHYESTSMSALSIESCSRCPDLQLSSGSRWAAARVGVSRIDGEASHHDGDDHET